MTTRTKSTMIDIDKKHRAHNTGRVEYARRKPRYIRLEADRPSDLPLIQTCLSKNRPDHIRQVHPGIFAVDLPADVFKIVWFVDGGFVVGTYANRMDRAEDL